MVTGAIWLIYRIGETVQSHSGYDFPWFSVFNLPWGLGARAHDYHHSHNRGVYGMYMFWDRIMGTDAEFRAYVKSGSKVEAAKYE